MPRPARPPRPSSAPPLRVVSLNPRSGRVTRQNVPYERASADDGAGDRRRARIRARNPRPKRLPPRPPTPMAPVAPMALTTDIFADSLERSAPPTGRPATAGPAATSRPPSRHGPALSVGKMRDYGYGVPQWSPYYRDPRSTPALEKPSSADYGYFPPSQSLSPALQMRSARANIIEMKGRATVDHMWETMGHRPGAMLRDLDWIAVGREQAALEESHWATAKSPQKAATAAAF